MGVKKFFFDSYALIEIMKGNPNYAKYVQEEVIFSIFNLVEVYYSSIHYLPEQDSQHIYNTYKGNVVQLSDEVIINAMKFRKKEKKRNLSYADCIGYSYAKAHNLIFLTGDKEFQNLEHVEFVK